MSGADNFRTTSFGDSAVSRNPFDGQEHSQENRHRCPPLRRLLLLILTAALCYCGKAPSPPPSLVNFSHLNRLYHEVAWDSLPAAYIDIYSEYPDYHPVEAPGEGIACVDDAARAAVLYLRHYRYTGDEQSLQKARKLLRFLINMQAGNGLFYNFIYGDHSINKTRKNSQPKADWWSWRAFWAFSEAYPLFRAVDTAFAAELRSRMQRIFPHIDSLLSRYPQVEMVAGFPKPAWLPVQGAADQAAVLLTGLVNYLNATADSTVRLPIRRIAEGILIMQISDTTQPTAGAFLSYQNHWHAWGNSQAVALLLAGNALGDSLLIRHALQEADGFYSYLEQEKFFHHIEFSGKIDDIKPLKTERFEQIAYDIRPLVFASLLAYEITGDRAYARQAGEIAGWLLGNNIAGISMYDPQTGRCYDGILSRERINKNSGAESTIEALLIILEVERNPIAGKVWLAYLHRMEQETKRE